MPVPGEHFVSGARLEPPFPDGTARAVFGMGCFWGAERTFWEIPGVYTTAVGYAGGSTPNPTYEEVCGGQTGHAEVVLVVFHPGKVGLEGLLRVFWRATTPRRECVRATTWGRSIGLRSTANRRYVNAPPWRRDGYQRLLRTPGHGTITTEIAAAGPFYYAEAYHQQYLAKNPAGYYGLGGTGVSCPVGVAGAGST